MKQISSLQSEIENTINWLDKYLAHAPGTLQFFYKLAESYFLEEKSDPKQFVPVVGTVFPEEYILSCGLKPWWVVGGSLELSQIPDEAIPRDADSVSRSVYGYLNYRKMGYLFSSLGRKAFRRGSFTAGDRG